MFSGDGDGLQWREVLRVKARLGRIRQVEATWLWLQQAVEDWKTKVAGARNPADILTNCKGTLDCEDHLTSVAVQVLARECDGGGSGGGLSGAVVVGGHAAAGQTFEGSKVRPLRIARERESLGRDAGDGEQEALGMDHVVKSFASARISDHPSRWMGRVIHFLPGRQPPRDRNS